MSITSNTPTVAAASTTDEEFGDYKVVKKKYGIGRSLCYQLTADGLIKSVSLRRKGQVRGKRLFHLESIRTYLNSLMPN